MKKILLILTLIFISNILSFTVQSSEEIKYKSIYSQGMTTVVLVDKNLTKAQLSIIGKSKCAVKVFCAIWFFEDEKKAQVGIERAKAGNLFDPIPGLISIYSKNKMVDKIICHEPKGTC